MTQTKLSYWFARLPLRNILRASHATALKVISTLMTMAFGILGARLYGAEAFGNYVSIFALAGLVSVATALGLPALFQREFASSLGDGDRSGLKPLVQGLAVVNALLFASLFLAIFFGAWIAVLVLVFCLLSNLTGLLGSLFIAHERVIPAIWIGDVIRPASALLALIALSVFATPSYLLPLFAQLIGVVVAGVTLLMIWHGEPLSNAKRAFSVAWWSDRHPAIIKAGLIFAGTQLLINLTTQVDILILTAMVSAEEVAHYYAAVRAALVVNFFFGASSLLAAPTLTRLHAAKERKEFQSLATQTAFIGAVVTVIAGAFAVALAPWYLGLYGPSFVVAFPSFCIFTGSIVARSFCGPAVPMLRAIRAERSLMAITAGVLVLNIAVSVTLVPWLGILGAAIGSGLQFAAYGVLLARAVARHGDYRSDVFIFPHHTSAKD